MTWWRGLAILLPAAALAACVERGPSPERLSLEPTSFAALKAWSEDSHAEALSAFRRSCEALLARPDEETMRPEGVAGTVADWRPACEAATAVGAREGPVDDARARRFFEAWFRPFEMANNEEREGLFTGYFELEAEGAMAPDARHRVPIYGRPSDLVTVDLGAFRREFDGLRIAGRVEGGSLRPLESRAEIESGALAGRGLELVWLEDPIDAFFLHVQGSGRVLFEDESWRRLGYADWNGHPYVAIGRELIARGQLAPETVSMQSIRAWLKAHPEEASGVMALNPSYVFFRWLPGDGSEPGPLGAQGVALTPGRSLAVDRRFVPLGAPVWLEAEVPLPNEGEGELRRLVVAQDTGSAIKGPVRGDLFWGRGPEAEWIAGHMKSRGLAYLLLPAPVAEAIASTAR